MKPHHILFIVIALLTLTNPGQGQIFETQKAVQHQHRPFFPVGNGR
jgi:hypothetical protein